MSPPTRIAYCALTVLIALYVVGAVSNGSLRHEVQTLPLWIPIVLGFQRRPLAKWAALPCLAFWLLVMILIWLFLLGWAHVLSGHFSPTEIAMTILIGAASLIAIPTAIRWRAPVRPATAFATAAALFVLQLAAFRVSLIPYIATR